MLLERVYYSPIPSSLNHFRQTNTSFCQRRRNAILSLVRDSLFGSVDHTSYGRVERDNERKFRIVISLGRESLKFDVDEAVRLELLYLYEDS